MVGVVSCFDINVLAMIRENVEVFMTDVSKKYVKDRSAKLLDIAPQDHKGARPFFTDLVEIDTLDIDPNSAATYIADLCGCINEIGNDKYDFIVCTEVLEHTRQPFNACENIYDLLKPGGYVFVTTPYNFRIHGPLPDCWRFTEYGLRELFKRFDIVSLDSLDSPDRFLMPIQYTLVAKKPIV